MRRPRPLPSALAALLLLGALAAAAAPPAQPDAAEARVRALEAKLMAPCCYTQTIDLHESDIARQMRSEVRAWVAQGLSDQQILDRYVARYGPRILAVPPAQGFNRLLYWMPYLVALVLLVGVCLTLWVWYRRGHGPGGEPLPRHP
jgi:cytochrome c-type biogenesis protein CcmH